MKEDKTLLDKMLDEFPDATPVPATTVQPKAKPSKIKRLFKGLGVIALGLGMAFGAKTIYDRYTGPQTDKPPIVDVDDQKANQLSDGTEQTPFPEVDGYIRIPEEDYDDYVYNLVDVNLANWADKLSKFVTVNAHDDYINKSKIHYFYVNDNYFYIFLICYGNTGNLDSNSYEYHNIIRYELSPNNANYLKNFGAPRVVPCINYILDNFSGECVSQLSATRHVLKCLAPVSTMLRDTLEGQYSPYIDSTVWGGIKDKDKVFVLAVDHLDNYATIEMELPNAKYDKAGCLVDFLYEAGYDFDTAFKKADRGEQGTYQHVVEKVGIIPYTIIN